MLCSMTNGNFDAWLAPGLKLYNTTCGTKLEDNLRNIAYWPCRMHAVALTLCVV